MVWSLSSLCINEWRRLRQDYRVIHCSLNEEYFSNHQTGPVVVSRFILSCFVWHSTTNWIVKKPWRPRPWPINPTELRIKQRRIFSGVGLGLNGIKGFDFLKFCSLVGWQIWCWINSLVIEFSNEWRFSLFPSRIDIGIAIFEWRFSLFPSRIDIGIYPHEQ